MKKIVKLWMSLVVVLLGFSATLQVGHAEDKTIKIVTSGTSVPYSVLDEKNNWTGVDAEIWEAIVKRTGWKIEIQRASFDSIFGELDAQRADVASNAFAVKAERTEKYYDSIPYYGDAQALVVAGDNTEVKTFEDLRGKKIGVTSGQASQTIIEEMAKEYEFEIVVYEDSNVGLQEVSMGRIDAQACAVTTANLYAEKTGNKVNILEEKLKANNVAFFFPKTDAGAALRDEVNEQLKALLEDGTVAKITEKYFGADMTKLIIQETTTEASETTTETSK